MGLVAGDWSSPAEGLQPHSSGSFRDEFPSKLEMVKNKPNHKSNETKSGTRNCNESLLQATKVDHLSMVVFPTSPFEIAFYTLKLSPLKMGFLFTYYHIVTITIITFYLLIQCVIKIIDKQELSPFFCLAFPVSNAPSILQLSHNVSFQDQASAGLSSTILYTGLDTDWNHYLST